MRLDSDFLSLSISDHETPFPVSSQFRSDLPRAGPCDVLFAATNILNTRIVTVNAKLDVTLWDAVTPLELWRLQEYVPNVDGKNNVLHNHAVRNPVFSDRGNYLIIRSLQTLYILDVLEARVWKVIRFLHSPVTDNPYAFTENNNRVGTAKLLKDSHSTIESTLRPLSVLSGLAFDVIDTSMSFLEIFYVNEGNTLLAVGADNGGGNLQIIGWNIQSRQIIQTSKFSEHFIHPTSFPYTVKQYNFYYMSSVSSVSENRLIIYVKVSKRVGESILMYPLHEVAEERWRDTGGQIPALAHPKYSAVSSQGLMFLKGNDVLQWTSPKQKMEKIGRVEGIIDKRVGDPLLLVMPPVRDGRKQFTVLYQGTFIVFREQTWT